MPQTNDSHHEQCCGGELEVRLIHHTNNGGHTAQLIKPGVAMVTNHIHYEILRDNN